MAFPPRLPDRVARRRRMRTRALASLALLFAGLALALVASQVLAPR